MSVNPAETGLYYLNSRYYDPQLGRFVNADGYASTGQNMTGYNMYACCGNNPVNRVDPTGQFWNEVFEFAKTAVTEIGKAMGAMSSAYTDCSEAIAVDGPLPFGDVAGLAAAALLTVGAIGYGIYQAAKTPSTSIPKVEEKDTTILPQPKKQAYFTVNPYDFTPKGLIMKEYPGTRNGRIIEWRDPISQAKIFEWNEDLRNGSHYHAMLIEWDGNHQGMHKLPGDPVPEPWNSIYFGG